MEKEFEELRKWALQDIDKADDLETLKKIRLVLMGRKGRLNFLLKKITRLPQNKRATAGELLNIVKQKLQVAIAQKQKELQKKEVLKSQSQWFDVTLPGLKPVLGKLHPTRIVIEEINRIFKNLGFSVVEGPEIETDEYNFERTNLPKDHPARGLWDTLYLKKPEILLRTHTSSVEARILEKLKPPIRIVIPGPCYRAETPNPSNNIFFFQYQGAVVDEGVNLAQLKWLMEYFVKKFFGQKTKMRLRSKYYPEVEPGVGVDIECDFCQGRGCSVCKGRGFLEVIGAGMHHPRMLEMAGINPQEYTGFHWGMGLDRIVMIRFGISDIRQLYIGEVVFT